MGDGPAAEQASAAAPAGMTSIASRMLWRRVSFKHNSPPVHLAGRSALWTNEDLKPMP